LKPLDSPETLIRENEQNFIEANLNNPQGGPLKYLTIQQKEVIHAEID